MASSIGWTGGWQRRGAAVAEVDEISGLLASVRAELSAAEAELGTRKAREQAELDALKGAAEDLERRRVALGAEQASLAEARTAAEATRAQLAQQELRLRERLGAALWASVAVMLLCALLIPYGLTSGRSLLITLGGQAAALVGGWLLASLRGRRRG